METLYLWVQVNGAPPARTQRARIDAIPRLSSSLSAGGPFRWISAGVATGGALHSWPRRRRPADLSADRSAQRPFFHGAARRSLRVRPEARRGAEVEAGGGGGGGEAPALEADCTSRRGRGNVIGESGDRRQPADLRDPQEQAGPSGAGTRTLSRLSSQFRGALAARCRRGSLRSRRALRIGSGKRNTAARQRGIGGPCSKDVNGRGTGLRAANATSPKALSTRHMLPCA
eukprot:364369-Chlamydomonas_euryale.AAC.13